MSRPIEFRAWNKETQRMVDLHANTSLALSAEMNTQMAIQGFGGLFIPFHKDIIIMQFTGLRDSKRTDDFPEGEKIWEGDVISGTSAQAPSYLKPIRWGKVTWTENGYYAGSMPLSQIHQREVIGSIHQNPELLEVTR